MDFGVACLRRKEGRAAKGCEEREPKDPQGTNKVEEGLQRETRPAGQCRVSADRRVTLSLYLRLPNDSPWVPVQVRRAQFLFRENFQPLDNDLLEFLTRITVPSPPVDFPIYSRLLGARGANTLCLPSAEGAPMNPDHAGPTEGKSFGRSAGFLACPQSVRAPAELWLHHKPVTGVDILPQTGMAARTVTRLDGLGPNPLVVQQRRGGA